MYTFISGLILLVIGYLVYSKYIEKIEGIDPERETPAYSMKDGVDYLPIPWWRVFLIQFLNIAGLGPIFGAVAGAMWGPVAFLWIVFGCVFGGAVHDYFSGMLSIRHKGLSITEIVGIYLGSIPKYLMRLFSVFLMIIVGAVFIMGPAKILNGMLPNFGSMSFWISLVFIYYFLATILPIDKLIGKLYPLFGFALLFMAVGLIIALIIKGYTIPELTFDSFRNIHVKPNKYPIAPMMFITIACGAISGFHATQSPMMARCITNEKYARRVFFGAMITEGIVAMIWAAISMSFFGNVEALNTVMIENNSNAAYIVNEISNSLLGRLGGALALLGVVAAPITSGDTAFRSARLIVADLLNFKQGPIKNRLLISFPLFVIGFLLTQIDFGIVWRYFAWANQTLATVVLWTITIYLVKSNKNYWVTFIPAIFMTLVITIYIFFSEEGFDLSYNTAIEIGVIISFLCVLFFWKWRRQNNYNLRNLHLAAESKIN